MALTRLEKISGIEEEIAQLKRRQTLLRQQQNKQDRKDRTHRICKRGGLVESLLPDLARLDDEQFQTFVDKVLMTPHTTRILAGLVPPLPDDTAAEPEGDTKAADSGSTTSKPAQSAQNVTIGSNVTGGNNVPQTS